MTLLKNEVRIIKDWSIQIEDRIGRTRPRDEILDLVRGLSAIIVLFAHTRGFILRDFESLGDTSLSVTAFYFLTSVHHQAVVVFFVLSGYFVGGSVLGDIQHDRFSWKKYGTARCARLWIALIPALLLTCVVDNAGACLNSEVYAGSRYREYASGPSETRPLSLGVDCFFGNLVFMQTILCPTYGTNGPLWSLSNEFWYYLLFPLILTSLFPTQMNVSRWGTRLICFTLAFFLILVLPSAIINAGVIWLMGVSVWLLSQRSELIPVFRHWIWRLTFGLLFLGSLAMAKVSSILGIDLAVGLAFSFWMPSLLGTWPKVGWWNNCSFGLSEISYTLYVTHFPLLFFVSATLFRGQQFDPNILGFSYFTCMSFGSLGIAYLMWRAFERNTNKIRRQLVAD